MKANNIDWHVSPRAVRSKGVRFCVLLALVLLAATGTTVSHEKDTRPSLDSEEILNDLEHDLAVRKFSFLLAAIEEYGVKHKSYPLSSWRPISEVSQILEFLPRKHLDRVSVDPWCGQVFYWSDGDFYLVVSSGPDGVLNEVFPVDEEEQRPLEEDDLIRGRCHEASMSYDLVGFLGTYEDFCGTTSRQPE